MPVDNIRLSEQAKNQLITLKRRTKITQWNVLCRWAFCRSLAEPGRPPAMQIPADSNVEMTWKTFASHWGDELWALLRMRVRADGLPLDEETLASQFRLHLHRGIGYLVGDPRVTDITGLLSLALEPETSDHS
jgi:DNA sulfur modification protein DndE